MRRLVLAVILVIGLAAVGVHGTHADIVYENGYCTDTSTGFIVGCPPTATPVAVLPAPVKDLVASAGRAEPFDLTAFTLTLTSIEGCFALPEPVYLYVQGNQDAVAIHQLTPVNEGLSGPPYPVAITQMPGSPQNGKATLSAEVFNAVVGPEGLAISALWPDEGVTHTVYLVPPAGGVPPATATPTPGATATPAPAPAPPAQAPLSVQACFQPAVLRGATLGGQISSLLVQSQPGAVCTAQVAYLDTTQPADFQGGPVTLGGSGQTSFPFTENSNADGGLGRVTCTAEGGQKATTCAAFVILQPDEVTLSASEQFALLQPIIQIAQNPAQCALFFGP